MNISYNWLKQYIDLKISPEELQEKMTFAGIEVEKVHQIGKDLKQLKVAEIVSKEKHPQADNLSICSVNDGSGEIQVICGAPNCSTGARVAFAPVGTQFDDFKIKKVKLRGVESYGMLCSEKELGISDNHDGIMILAEDAPVGQDLASYLNMEDTVFEVEITPNRPDLLGIIGVARDLSALLDLPLKIPKVLVSEIEKKIENHLILENRDPDLCLRYTARLIENITIKDSPEWLKRRLLAVGLRPINNIVDITNFVLMEYGHPLHAFDYDKIAGKKIIVRRAEMGEKFPALDEETYTLTNEDLVIADSEKPVALAGVIGGMNSHITTETKNIVLESANFLYSTIRRTSAKFQINTDSSYRFERNLSDQSTEDASLRTAQLVLELAGGDLLKGKLDSYPDPVPLMIISVRKSRIKKLLSIELDDQQIIKYLKGLELKYLKSEGDKLFFEVPAFRKDLIREVDLLEEIMRLHGYNNIESFLSVQNIMDRPRFMAKRNLKSLLLNQGFSEIINWSFADPENLDKLKLAAGDPRRNTVNLRNPLGQRFSIMRSTLIPDLLKTALFNINRGRKDLKIFELNKVFTNSEGKLARERFHLTGLLLGNLDPVYWKNKNLTIDLFDVKGIAEDLLTDLSVTGHTVTESEELFYQQGHSGDFRSDGNIIGSFGKLDPKIAQDFGLEQPIFLFDIYLDNILDSIEFSISKLKEISKYPPVLRDISFIIPIKYQLQEVIDTMFQINWQCLDKIVLFDEYKGKNISDGYRSLSFNLIFVSSTKTLTDEYINNIINKIIKTLEKNYQIELR